MPLMRDSFSEIPRPRCRRSRPRKLPLCLSQTTSSKSFLAPFPKHSPTTPRLEGFGRSFAVCDIAGSLSFGYAVGLERSKIQQERFQEVHPHRNEPSENWNRRVRANSRRCCEGTTRRCKRQSTACLLADWKWPTTVRRKEVASGFAGFVSESGNSRWASTPVAGYGCCGVAQCGYPSRRSVKVTGTFEHKDDGEALCALGQIPARPP